MAQTLFCSKCGASLLAGADRCRNCYTPVGQAQVVALAAEAARPDGNPFVSMWLHPRETIRGILDSNATYLVVPLAAVGGVWQTLDRLASRNAADTLSLPVVLLIALIFGPLGGIFGLYVGGGLVQLSGRWIGGEASGEEVRASMAWGAIPAIWGGLLWIPAIALTGTALFKSDIPDDVGPILLMAGAALLLLQVVTGVWAFFTSLKSLSEAQGFSTWKAFGNFALAGAVVLVPVLLFLMAVTIGLAGFPRPR